MTTDTNIQKQIAILKVQIKNLQDEVVILTSTVKHLQTKLKRIPSQPSSVQDHGFIGPLG